MDNSRFAFISYSRNDQDFAKEVVETLEAKGVKVYIDYRDILPGAVFAEEIVNAIENSLCCILIFTDSSNNSGYVLSEMNSAVNHNKPIIPLRVNGTMPSKALEFYLGKNNWIDYIDISSLDLLIKTIKGLSGLDDTEQKVKYKGPVVLRNEVLSEIGYTTEKKVIETIEIDYRTLGEAPNEYSLDDETEGTVYDWIDYANSYPETSSMLIVDDRIVGYYQLVMVNKDNYQEVISGKKMINSSMEEFYGFGGDFYCYIASIFILREYETQKNHLLLLNDLLQRMVEFANDGINMVRFGISVYTPLLETMVKTLGFEEVGTNPTGGKIMELTSEKIVSSPIFKKRYPEFYKIYGGD